jgi:hypothetical protein
VGEKRLAVERIAAVPGISGVIDGLHIWPASPMSDDGIRDPLRKAFIQEPEFRRLRIMERVNDDLQLVRDAYRILAARSRSRSGTVS